ncbi:MAG: hypothetical protein R3B07_05725 [Polyangiaceae bacterium]
MQTWWVRGGAAALSVLVSTSGCSDSSTSPKNAAGSGGVSGSSAGGSSSNSGGTGAGTASGGVASGGVGAGGSSAGGSAHSSGGSAGQTSAGGAPGQAGSAGAGGTAAGSAGAGGTSAGASGAAGAGGSVGGSAGAAGMGGSAAGSSGAGGATPLGETCEDPLDLVALSSASSRAAYDFEVSGSLGSTNDYDPTGQGGLPPNCTFIGQAAIGRDIVFRVELKPGQRFDYSLELDPTSARPAAFLLAGCSPVAMPDFDGNGICGSDEYQWDSCIGVCELTKAFTYPTLNANGQPNVTRSFFLVVDEYASKDFSTNTFPAPTATGYHLYWKISG